MRLDKLRVLIVDDNAMDRELAKEALEGIKLEDVDAFEVAEARYGKDGLTMALSGNHDVVLLDYNLPDTNGIEILKSIQASPNKIPVIAMTSLGGEDVAKKFIQGGAQDYITKDQLTDVRLATTIRNVVWLAKIDRRVKRITSHSRLPPEQ